MEERERRLQLKIPKEVLFQVARQLGAFQGESCDDLEAGSVAVLREWIKQHQNGNVDIAPSQSILNLFPEVIEGEQGRNVVRNSEGDYWSNQDGWTEFQDCATRFTDEERQILSLPIGGSWEVIG